MIPRPSSKTVVAEVKVTVADISTRSMILKAAAAAKVGEATLYNIDRIVTTTDFMEIQKINSFLAISCSSASPLIVEYTSGTEIFSTKVNNLFVLSGSITTLIRIKSETGSSRITVVYN